MNMADTPRMREPDPDGVDGAGPTGGELREQVSAALLDRLELISTDTIAILPHRGAEALDSEQCRRLVALLAQLLIVAVRDGRIDFRGSMVGDLHRLVLERGLSTEWIFVLGYMTERAAFDQLAMSEVGATTEPWPVVVQLVRRASFDVLAAFAERVQLEPRVAPMVDRLTTLYTRSLFDAVLAKEAERAGRHGHSMSIILFDVDRLADVNRNYGYGVGDKLLERLGILIRKYFRLHDWVARYSEDAIVVLLTQGEGDQTADLAEQTRRTIEERLWFTDHRTDQRVPVTVSAAVVNLTVPVGGVIDANRLLADAESTLDRAKQRGRNRVERLDRSPGSENAS
jgi:diguanylate cyclase (GGDEF)-like protein